MFRLDHTYSLFMSTIPAKEALQCNLDFRSRMYITVFKNYNSYTLMYAAYESINYVLNNKPLIFKWAKNANVELLPNLNLPLCNTTVYKFWNCYSPKIFIYTARAGSYYDLNWYLFFICCILRKYTTISVCIYVSCLHKVQMWTKTNIVLWLWDIPISSN
jgi:hypothetical protein